MPQYMTKQRRALLDFFEAHPDRLFSALQIVAQLEEDTISISAVYRNLSALMEDGMVRCHQKAGSREIFYQYVDNAHCRGKIHLSCVKCDRLFHMSDANQYQLLTQLAQLEGFQLSTESTVLRGVCAQCSTAEGVVFET